MYKWMSESTPPKAIMAIFSQSGEGRKERATDSIILGANERLCVRAKESPGLVPGESVTVLPLVHRLTVQSEEVDATIVEPKIKLRNGGKKRVREERREREKERRERGSEKAERERGREGEI